MKEQRSLPVIKGDRSRFFYGYVIVIVAFAVTFVIYGTLLSFGVFFKPLLAEFGWTRAATSGAYSLNFFLQGVFGIFVGRLSDRFGPRSVVTVCGLLLGLGYLLMPYVNAIWQIYLFFGILVSAGTCGFVSMMSTVAKWFIKRRGLMTGIVAAGSAVGIVAMPPLANYLISSYNWRTSYTIMGLMALAITVIAAQFLKRDPGHIGQLPDGAKVTKTEESHISVRGLSLSQAVHTRQLWLICGAQFIIQFSVQIVVVHIVPHATDIGITAASAATILSIAGALTIGSKVGIGNVVDRLGNKRVLIIALIMNLGAFLWVYFASELWMFYIFAILIAIAWGGQAVTQSPVIAEYFGLKAHGAIFGIVFLSYMTGGAIGPLVAGRIFDVRGDYGLAFVVSAVLSVVGLILLIPLKLIGQDKRK